MSAQQRPETPAAAPQPARAGLAAPPPTRAGLAVPLGRLWLCGLFVAVALGAYDVVKHAPQLRWFEAGEVLGLYALFGGLAALAALPVAALLLVLLRRWLGLGRAAAVLLAAGVGGVVVVALEQGALTREAAFVALALTAFVAARASALRSFESTERWRVRRGLAATAVVALAAAPPIGRYLHAPGGGGAAQRPPGPPDMVLIVLDTQRADHLGAYGDPRGLSPAFDAFAKEGALYDGCFSSAPWTVPSHASLFTGLHPPSHGCSFEHHRWLDQRFVTLAEALAERSYQTAAFVANDWLFKANLLQGFEACRSVGGGAEALSLRPLLELLGWPARYADHGAAEAIERIDGWLARERADDRPLFLFVNLLEAHWRYLPPIGERLAQTCPQPGVVTATSIATRFYGPLVMGGKRIGGPVEPSIRALYAAAVRYQDEKLAELLEVLRTRLDLDRTVVAITSDHGENLGEGGRWDHVFAVNDALVHVPLAIRYPPAFPAGTRVPGICQLVDLPVTLFSLASPDRGALLGEGLAGRSLLPDRFERRDVALLFGDPYLGHLERMTWFAGFNRDVVPWTATLRAARGENHKLVRSSVRGEELFDLRSDRDEVNDVSAAMPEVRDALRGRLDAELSTLPGYDGPPRRPPEDDVRHDIDEERLQAMGYAGGRRPPR